MKISEILDLAIAIQQVPAPTFAEKERGEMVRDLFTQEGLLNVTMDTLGNVFGRLPGRGAMRPLVLTAHLDTVFPADTDLHIMRTPDRIAGPGIGDNSLAPAGLLGLVRRLRAQGVTLPGDVWLVGNVGEEGLGDLNGMRAVVDRFGDTPLAYIVVEGMALGHVFHRALGVRRYRVHGHTKGGHSWGDYGQPSAIHALAALITQITSIPLPQQPRTTLNVGVIAGGTTINTIAAHAHFDLDLRSTDPETLVSLSTEVAALTEAANSSGVKVSIEQIGSRPAGELPVEHPLVQLAVQCIEAQGLSPYLNIGSTDANIPLSRGLPAICVGLTTGENAHTIAEFIRIPPLEKGMAQLEALVKEAFSTLDGHAR